MKEEIIEMLMKSGDYVSGEEISRRLGVSRTAIWKSINNLRKEGYVIESSTNKGYRLCSTDLLDKSKICSRLRVRNAGTRLEIMKTVDSTNNEVRRRAALGEGSGLIIAAEEQTGGKGRFGRVWSSSDGGLYFSLLLRPELPPSDISSVTLAAGYAVCMAIREHTGLDAMIKWPNDIIIGRKKVCGILTEMSAQSDMVEYIVIGIGINVNNESFPEEIKDKACSLYLETGKKLDRSLFFRDVILRLDEVLSAFFVSLSIDDIKSFSRLCATIGRRVSTVRGQSVIEGEAIGVTAAGELIIRTDDKAEQTINSGEVTVQGIY